jgi:sugar phosphate isomerase/epimerase
MEQLALIGDCGLTVSSVQPRLHSLFPDLPRPQPQEPAERMALYRKTIELFGKAAPGTTLVSITGAAPAGDYRTAFEVAAREYRALADFAADHGVRIAVEPLNPILMNVDSFICTLADAMRIADAVDRPNFGIFVDVWHIWQHPVAETEIIQCGDRIFGVHVNDWHTPRRFGDRAMIGTGQIPLARLLRAIRQAGYRGAYTLELFSDESLPDSLWKRELNQVIWENLAGFDKAWKKSHAIEG